MLANHLPSDLVDWLLACTALIVLSNNLLIEHHSRQMIVPRWPSVNICAIVQQSTIRPECRGNSGQRHVAQFSKLQGPGRHTGMERQ